MEEKYILIKPYKCKYGTLKEGSEIIIFRGFVYFDGGLVTPAYESFLMDLLGDDEWIKEYTKKERIIHNKA